MRLPGTGDYNQVSVVVVYLVLALAGLVTLLRLQLLDPSSEYQPLQEPDAASDVVRVTHQYCALCSERRGSPTYYRSFKRKHCR
jgi:hypothetical protein